MGKGRGEGGERKVIVGPSTTRGHEHVCSLKAHAVMTQNHR